MWFLHSHCVIFYISTYSLSTLVSARRISGGGCMKERLFLSSAKSRGRSFASCLERSVHRHTSPFPKFTLTADYNFNRDCWTVSSPTWIYASAQSSMVRVFIGVNALPFSIRKNIPLLQWAVPREVSCSFWYNYHHTPALQFFKSPQLSSSLVLWISLFSTRSDEGLNQPIGKALHLPSMLQKDSTPFYSHLLPISL